jgi:2-polyprenyl-3-methyl-5-hydroxy-6-metoxy-1,4-benzoquinol methylase
MNERGRPESEDVRAAWDANAAFWDQQMESGGTWQQFLIEPAVERVLRLEKGERVLEVACGNGEFARRMAELGATVLATDFSEAMLERARAHGGDVEYRQVDATDEAALAALGESGPFDAVVCNMALMDMREIEPLARGAWALLRPDGRLLLSSVHPAFNSGTFVLVTERSEDADGLIRRHYVKVSNYAQPYATRGVAVEGQPVLHWYFHRSLTDLLRPFLSAGFVVEDLDEPVLPPGRVDPDGPAGVFHDVPPVVVVRLRR